MSFIRNLLIRLWVVRRYQRPDKLQAEAIFNLYNPFGWVLLLIAAFAGAFWYALAGAFISIRELFRDTVGQAWRAEMEQNAGRGNSQIGKTPKSA